MDSSKAKNVAAEWSPLPDGQVEGLGLHGKVMAEEITEFEMRLFEWIRQSDFEEVPWSTKKAAKSFKVKEDEIYESLAALTRKLPNRIQISYADGNLHIAAE